MNLFNLAAVATGAKSNALMLLDHVALSFEHLLNVLRDTVRSEEVFNRGELRGSMILFSTPVEDDGPAVADRKAMWASAEKDAGHCSFEQVHMAGSPLFVFGEDKQELELEDCDEDFEGVNHLLVSSTDGPMIVSLEFRTSTAVEAEDVGCSTACTVFWDQDPSTTILSRTLDEITSVLDARLKQGYDTSTFHYTKDLIKDVMASVGADEDDQMSLVSLTVSLCHTIRSLTAIDDEDEADTRFTGRLVKGDLVGVMFRAVATLSDSKDYTIGFERIVRVEDESVSSYPAYLIVNKLRTENLSSSRDLPQRKLEPIRVDTYKHQRIIKTVLNDAASSPQPPFSLLGINQDDWAGWDKLYSRSGSGPGDTVHSIIFSALSRSFPDTPTFGRRKAKKVIQAFLDQIIAEQALESLGRLNSAGREISSADICAYAVLMYLLGVNPGDDRFPGIKLPSDYLDMFRTCLPHLRHDMALLFDRHRANLTAAYRAIEAMGEEERTAALLTLMSEENLAVVMRFRERADQQ